jgi:hypothetical protein
MSDGISRETVKLVKTRPASQNYGRGTDQCYRPAEWAVEVDGRVIGYAKPVGYSYYMNPTFWQAVKADGTPLGVTHKTRAAAVARVLKTLEAQS